MDICGHLDGVGSSRAFLQQVHLIGADVLLAELVRWPMEVTGEIFHDLQVCFYGSLREITTLELFQHHCSEMGHRDLLVTQRLRRFADSLNLHTRAASAARAASFKRRSIFHNAAWV